MAKRASKSLTADFKILNYFSQLFGVDMMFKSRSNLKIFANYLLLVGNIFCVIFANTVDSSYPRLCRQQSVSIAVSKLTQILCLITSASIYLQVVFHKKTVLCIEKRLQTVDLLFSKLNIRFSHQKFNIVIKLSLVAVITVNLAVFTILCIHYGLKDWAEIGLRFITNFHPLALIYLITLLDVYLCWLVRMKLCALSVVLAELCEFKDTTENTTNWKVKLVDENPKIFFVDLIKISEIYEILYETIGEMNSAFGWFSLSSIALESISITCHVFLLFKAATAQSDIGIKTEILVQVLWILLFSAPVMLLIFVYYSTVLQANTVSMVIYETVAGKDIKTQSTQLEMDLISLQLLHEQPYFTACGFFYIDMTLAYAIVGAVTTYLVILLQFNSE